MPTQNIYDLVDTWNAGATTFTAVKMNVTDTASAAGSLLMDLQVGGSSKFKVDKAGTVTVGNQVVLGSSSAVNTTFSNNSMAMLGSGAGFQVYNGAFIGFSSTGTSVGTADVLLTRRAAANLRLGAADAAGSAIAISSVASNQLTLASNHGLTTGAAIIITGTAAPSGTTLNTRYYARVIAAAVIELYSTYDQATAASGTTGIIAVTTAGTSASVRLATPFQSFGVQDFTGTDIPGQPFIIRGSRGTGTGPGGELIFQVAPAGSSGTAQNALATALTIASDQNITSNGGAGKGFFLGTSGSIRQYTATALALYDSAGAARAYVGGSASASLGIVDDGPIVMGAGADTRLYRDAPGNILALRNGANAQTFRVYNTTDGTNSEMGFLRWSSNIFQIGTEKAGMGSNRPTQILSAGDIYIYGASGSATYFGFSSDPRWYFSSSSHLLAFNDNQYDIGASGSQRPRHGYFGGNLVAGGSLGLQIGTGSAPIYWAGRSQVYSPANGNILLQNAAQSDFDRLQFGGTTSSFPAIKRSSTTLQARLADDSAFASVQGKLTTDTAYQGGDPTTTGYLVVYDSTGTAYKIPAVAV